MSKMRLLYNTDTWDAATVTSSSELGSQPDTNALTDYIGAPWRASGDSAEWIKFDLGGATEITQISLLGLSLTAAATVTVEAHTSDSWGAPDLSQVIAISTDADSVVYQRLTAYLTANNTKQWWRITFADAANPSGRIVVGRIKGGAYYEVPRNIDEGFFVQHADPSEGAQSPGTLAPIRKRTGYRILTVTFSHIVKTQRRKMEAIFSNVGNNTPLVVGYDPDEGESECSMFCRLLTPLNTAYNMINDFGQGALVFEEITS